MTPTSQVFTLDPVIGYYVPSIPLPFYGRNKWWHFRTHFVCGECRQGFRKEKEYQEHYKLLHTTPWKVEL